MKNIAVIGLSENLKIFNLTGVENVLIAKNLKDAEEMIKKLIKEDFLIILVEDKIYVHISKIVLKQKEKQFPVMVCLNSYGKQTDDITLNEIKSIVGDSLSI